MPYEHDFEREWLTGFSGAVDRIAGEEVRRAVMADSENLSSDSSSREVISWSREALERLESLVNEESVRKILTSCACQYPRANLLGIRKRYRDTEDADEAHRLLQEQFVSFLQDAQEQAPAFVYERG